MSTKAASKKAAKVEPKPETTELAVIPPVREAELVHSVTESTVNALRESVSGVTICGVSKSGGVITVHDPDAMLADKAGLKAVRESRMRAVKARTTCSKEHLAARDYHNKEAKRIIAEEKSLVALIEEIEKPLVALEQAVEDELDRRQRAAADALYTMRRDALLVVAGPDFGTVDEQLLRSIVDDDSFMRLKEQCLDNRKRHEEAEAERARQKAEADRIAEENRLAAEKLAEDRRKFEAEQAEAANVRKLEQDRLDREANERQRLANEQLAEQRRLLEEQAEKDRIAREQFEADKRALEEQKRQMEADIERAATEKREREEAAEQERLRLENDAIREIDDGPKEGESLPTFSPEFMAAAEIEASTPITIGASGDEPTDSDLLDAAEVTFAESEFRWIREAAVLIVREFDGELIGAAHVDQIANCIKCAFAEAEMF